MRRIRIIAAGASLLGGLATAHAGGGADISFVTPGLYSDAGWAPSVRDRNLKVLGDFLTRLSSDRLATGQTLKLEVLDVDLAGITRPNAGPTELRIANGGADWPRIRLRYALEQGGQVVKSGEARIADLNYLDHAAFDVSNTDPLRHEKRMLRQWFDTEIATRPAAGAAR